MRVLSLSVCLTVCLSFAPAMAQAPTAKQSVWDGVYTAAQADRGDKVYAERCSSCHGGDMRGGAGVPGLVGTDLLVVWNNQPAWPLFDLMRGTMPQDNPGGLNDQQYVDILAALFRGTRMPTGTTELTATREALERVMITRAQN